MPLSEEELTELRSIPSEPELAAEEAGEGVALFHLPNNHNHNHNHNNNTSNHDTGNRIGGDNGMDNGGLVFWLGTRGYLRPFKSPMSFGQLNVTSSGMRMMMMMGMMWMIMRKFDVNFPSISHLKKKNTLLTIDITNCIV